MGRQIAGRGVAIVGYAQSALYRRAPVPLASLTVQACRQAIEDAGLTPNQIDGAATYPTLPAGTPHTEEDGRDIVTADYIIENMGLRTCWNVNHVGWGQIGSALIHAINAISVGAADTVLLFRALHNPPGRYHGYGANLAPGPRQWSAPYGAAGPAAGIGFPYREYLERYGATHEEMATLVTAIRKNVQNNPLAYWYGQPLTRDDYLASRFIGDPIRMHDCDIPLDGAAALVLTAADRARDTRHKPVYIAGYVQSHYFRPGGMGGTLDQIMEPGLEAGKRLWAQTGFSPSDIDCPQIYDGFSPLTYFWLECMGFCGVGEAHSFIQDGRIDLSGPFPLLSGGGNLGNGRLHGMGHIRENYLQLSQRAGERQLPKATLGIATHSFPSAGAAVVYSAEPS